MIATLLCLLILLLIVLSAFFSSSEITFAKANRFRIEKAAESGNRTAKIELQIIDEYVRTLSAILVGNNLVNIAASSASTMLFVRVFNIPDGAVVASVVITVLLLIFGETLPKIVAAALPDQLARRFAYPMKAAMIIFKPVVFAVEKLVSSVEHLWTPKEETPDMTSEELVELVDNIEEEGVFTEEESELIKSAIEITDTMAMDVLTPRVDLVAIDYEDGVPELNDELMLYTRIPVYRDTIDNIIGMISTKQLVKAIAAGQDVTLDDLMTPPLFVHKTRMISSIIREFRDRHIQAAIVVDEYGGTLGLVTMEDIMEEIVGEIYDERDAVEDEIIQIDEHTFIVDGDTNIYDLFDVCDYEPQEFDSEYNTVGGWVTEQLDRFPKAGDNFTWDRFTVRVLEAHGVRVEKVKVILADPPEEE